VEDKFDRTMKYNVDKEELNDAREILENGEESPNEEITKPVSLAMWEIMEGKVVLTKKPVDKQEK